MSEHNQVNDAGATDGAAGYCPPGGEADGSPAETVVRPRGSIVTRLAELPDRAFIDERALAEAFGVTKRTVRRMVGRYELPPPVRFAGRSMWEVRKILAWFESRADRLAREAERQARRLGEIL